MKPWWRSLIGIGAGAANLFANGTNWKQVLVSLGVGALGVVTHLSSTSDPTNPTGKAPQFTTHVPGGH